MSIKYSKGIMWLDDCRIPYVNGIENEFSETYLRSGNSKSKGNDLILNISGNKREGVYVNNTGRFSPNLLVCDDMLNDGSVYKSGDGKSGMKLINHNVNNFAVGEDCSFHKESKTIHYGDKGSSSRYYDLDKWFDKVIDEIR